MRLTRFELGSQRPIAETLTTRPQHRYVFVNYEQFIIFSDYELQFAGRGLGKPKQSPCFSNLVVLWIIRINFYNAVHVKTPG